MKKEQRQYIKSLYMQIKKEEAQMRDKPVPKLTREDFFLFHETGNRLVYENAYFGRRKYLTVYAILALWSDELFRLGIIDEKSDDAEIERYIDSLTDILSGTCEEQFWALPAHVDFDKIACPETEITIDLFAAETAQALSEIILRLYDRLPCEVVMRVASDVMRRVLQPFVLSAVPYSWWETDRCNWSAVCAGSVGMAAINIDQVNRRLMADCKSACQAGDELPAGWQKTCLRRVCDSLQCYLDGMEADGACTEGLGYYNYGMSFYAAFAEQFGAYHEQEQEAEQLMYRAKCDQIALFQQKCYFTSRHGGVSISFSDGSSHESFLPGLTAYLKHCYPQVQTPDYGLARPFDEDACYRYLTNERNISWLIKYAGSDEDADFEGTHQQAGHLTAYLLPAAQWLICQDANGNGFAAKGGNNDENHNHNDIGHFLCVFNGEMLLTDLGAGEYTKDYFSDRRYDILCNRSEGHSVPLINGGEQCAGKEYHADGFSWDERESALTISFAGAYPKGCIGKLVRRIRMREQMQIEVQDVFTANENTRSIAENLVTEYEPEIEGSTVWIRGLRGRCRIDVENCSDSGIKVVPCAHSDHAGSPQTIYRITWNLCAGKCSDAVCKMWITFLDE